MRVPTVIRTAVDYVRAYSSGQEVAVPASSFARLQSSGPGFDLELPDGSSTRLPARSYFNAGTIAAPVSTTTINSTAGVVGVPAAMNLGVLLVGSLIEVRYVFRLVGVAATALFWDIRLGTANAVSDAVVGSTAGLTGWTNPGFFEINARIVIASTTRAQSSFFLTTPGGQGQGVPTEADISTQVSFSADNFLTNIYSATPVAGTDVISILVQDVRCTP